MPTSKSVAKSLLLLAATASGPPTRPGSVSGGSKPKPKSKKKQSQQQVEGGKKKKKAAEMSMDDEPLNNKEAGGDEDEDETTKKSERKRMREKQRRSDLTNAFDDLSALVLKLESKDKGADEEEREPQGRKKSRRLSSGRGDGVDEASGLTRVDLIAKALGIMKRLHQENAQLKQALTRSSHQRDKNEIMVMVPTLTPADDTQSSPAGAMASYRPPPYGYPLPQYSHEQAPPYPPAQQSPRYHQPPPLQWGGGGGYRDAHGPPPVPPIGHRYAADNRGTLPPTGMPHGVMDGRRDSRDPGRPMR